MSKLVHLLLPGVIFLSTGVLAYAEEAAPAETEIDAVTETAAAEEPQAFGGVVVGQEQGTGIVEAIDAEARTVTLRNEAGDLKTLPCGPEVRNFDQIKVGDKVTMTVTQYAEIAVIKDMGAPLARKDEQEIVRAPLGEKPAGIITRTVNVMAIVDSIDYASRQVTLQGPEKKVTVEVGPEAVNFDKVVKGDNVYLKLTEQTSVTVTGESNELAMFR